MKDTFNRFFNISKPSKFPNVKKTAVIEYNITNNGDYIDNVELSIPNGSYIIYANGTSLDIFTATNNKLELSFLNARKRIHIIAVPLNTVKGFAKVLNPRDTNVNASITKDSSEVIIHEEEEV